MRNITAPPTHVIREYQGHPITYREDGWFNATEAAAKFGRRPIDWINLPSTDNYIGALCRQLRSEKISLLKVIRGGRNHADGTWLHPKLAVPFARWLDDDFAVWCDFQIDALIRGGDDWTRQRHSAAASYKVMTQMLHDVRLLDGKECQVHHYTNEARLVNWALAGKFSGLDRDQMTRDELDLLAHLEIRNTIMMAQGNDYAKRKGLLHTEAATWWVANQPKITRAA
ncbi:KilA-N domain-containing protein [Polaromonas sp.]|uniref:KilA-N domain-containing protein n=1 Tax=Polaromonas sp. TaxID=1869339 RepID=UPI003752DEDA